MIWLVSAGLASQVHSLEWCSSQVFFAVFFARVLAD